MSRLERVTKQILRTIEEVVRGGETEFRPGHVAEALRNSSTPMLTYQIRGEFAKLAALGIIRVDPKTGNFTLDEESARKAS